MTTTTTHPPCPVGSNPQADGTPRPDERIDLTASVRSSALTHPAGEPVPPPLCHCAGKPGSTNPPEHAPDVRDANRTAPGGPPHITWERVREMAGARPIGSYMAGAQWDRQRVVVLSGRTGGGWSLSNPEYKRLRALHMGRA